MMATEPSRPPPGKVPWRVWLKRDPTVFAEVEEQFWMDARVLGACDISARTGEPVFFDELEITPVSSNVALLDVERLRRKMLAAQPTIR
jgi:hypothetical protein